VDVEVTAGVTVASLTASCKTLWRGFISWTLRIRLAWLLFLLVSYSLKIKCNGLHF
jgi:hypothetical protein